LNTKIFSAAYKANLNCGIVRTSNAVDQEVLASSLIGLGLWRLRPYIYDELRDLASRVEGIIRQCGLDDGLEVCTDKKFEYRDSIDPLGEKDKIDPFFATHTPYSNKLAGDLSRTQLENRVYRTRSFSKIILSFLVRRDNLQVFQMVVHPQPSIDLPIIYICLVGNKNSIQLAMVDPSSVRSNGSFPDFYADALTRLQKHFSLTKTSYNMDGGNHSPFCISLKPKSEEETDHFMKYACSFIRTHFEIARITIPIKSSQTKLASQLVQSKHRFCIWQQKNSVIRRILLESFGEKNAQDYLSKFFFSLCDH
jgi:hypothetical protein